MTIIDWRAKSYRGGSRWISAGVIAASVGLSLPESVIVPPSTLELSASYVRTLDLSASAVPTVEASASYIRTLELNAEVE